MSAPGEPRSDYRAAMAALRAADQHWESGLAEVERAYLDGCRTAEATVAAAETALVAARQRCTDRHRARAETDATAEHLWYELSVLVGRRGVSGREAAGVGQRRASGRRGPAGGGLPEPDRDAPADPAVARAMLDRATRTVALARRGEFAVVPPVPPPLAMAVAGVIGAVLLMVLAKAMLSLGDGADRGLLASLVAQLSVVAAPFIGIPIGQLWLKRYACSASGWAMVLSVAVGLASSGVMFAILLA